MYYYVLLALSHFVNCKKKEAKCMQYYIWTQTIFSCEDPFVIIHTSKQDHNYQLLNERI
jgi:hypothetical protein